MDATAMELVSVYVHDYRGDECAFPVDAAIQKEPATE
jgi:hypothetical protein